MNSQENKQIIKDYFDAAGIDKNEAMDNFIVDQHLKDHIILFEAGLPGYQLHAEDIIAEGDKVVVRCQVIGTHTGTLFDIPATGKNVQVPLIIIYQLEDGKIVDHWMQADTLSLMQQIDAIPVS